MELNNQQRKKLKGLAHPLSPVVTIAERGLAPSVVHELSRALDDHELIKVKVRVGDRGARDELITQMCATTESTLVTRIGNVAVLYRAHPEKPAIKL